VIGCIIEQFVFGQPGAFQDAVDDALKIFEYDFSGVAVFGLDWNVKAHGFAVSFDYQCFTAREECGGFVFEFADADAGHGILLRLRA
jgi:hypothetical protein